MSTMAEHVIAAGVDNRPPMLDNSQYNSWQSRMLLYIKGKEHGKQRYDSVINGPFQYGTVEIPTTPTTLASIRDRTYEDLTEAEKILAKEIWDSVKLLIEDDPIASLNKAMAFISTTFASRYPPTNNQLRTLSNLGNQATIQDGGVTVQNVQGRQTQGYVGNGARGNATCTWVNRNVGTNTTNQAKALEAGVVLDEEHMAFLANNGDIVATGQDSHELTTTTIFQTNDLDAFDFDCDEVQSASAVLMDKLSTYDSDVLLKMQNSEQPSFINDSDIDITSASNVISYDQYLKETENEVVQDTTSNAQQDALIMSVIEEMSNQKIALGYQNPLYLTQAQRKQPALYCGHTIVRKHDALSMNDTEETLKLDEESKLKMLAKQNDLIAQEKK
ncbi:hypothetical protein Tco_0524010 [Tanacetum coccineum]